MKNIKEYLEKAKKFFSKLYTRFSNYKNDKKWFVLYLIVLTLCLFVFFPVVKVDGSGVRFLFSGVLWKSSLVILIAMIGLFMWNLSISFKTWVTKLCSLREDEPLVDFLLLWIIVSVFIGVMDGTNIVNIKEITTRVELSSRGIAINGLLLLGGLVWSFISLRKSSQKTARKAKIVNIVEERHPSETHRSSGQSTHLFDDLRDEE